MNRLKEMREKKELWQKDIADYLKITQQTYSEYELEKRKIPLWLMIKLANYYNTSIDYLAGLTDEEKPYPKRKEDN